MARGEYIRSKLAELDDALPATPWRGNASFAQLFECSRSLSASQRTSLCSLCDELLAAELVYASDNVRSSVAGRLIALLPESGRVIERWIAAKTTRETCEVQFSLLLFLDRCPKVPGGRDFARRVPGIVEAFLMNVPTRMGGAAFIAGDLMGDHWDLVTALPVLLRVATDGRFVAGRESALHGLEHAYGRLQRGSGKREQVRQMLRQVAGSDDSAGLRQQAEQLLDHLAHCGTPCSR